MEKVKIDAEQALSALENVFSKFDSVIINKIPFEGSWTAGQLVQHMVLSNGGFVEMINESVEETNRPADLKVNEIKEIFLNFDVNMDSPEFVYPKQKEYNQAELQSKLTKIKTKLSESIANLDLLKTCTMFELPGMGFLTRLEAIYFMVYHTQRHTKQLEHIYSKLA